MRVQTLTTVSNATSSPASGLVGDFQNLVAQVPDAVQPIVVALAATIPFIEGEVAASIGVVGGIDPVIAVVAGIIGNMISVTVVVLLSSRLREVIATRFLGQSDDGEPSPRRAKFQRAFERYGVPGVSLLGPLILPTQLTATALVGLGVPKARVLGWQAVTIVLWTIMVTLVVTGVLNAL